MVEADMTAWNLIKQEILSLYQLMNLQQRPKAS